MQIRILDLVNPRSEMEKIGWDKHPGSATLEFSANFIKGIYLSYFFKSLSEAD